VPEHRVEGNEIEPVWAAEPVPKRQRLAIPVALKGMGPVISTERKSFDAGHDVVRMILPNELIGCFVVLQIIKR
jgi:hypothetical protein